MKRTSFLLLLLILIFGTTAFLSSPLNATEIQVALPFHYRDNISANSVGYVTQQTLEFGAEFVVPNGDNGTTGWATQGTTIKPLTFFPFSVAPNFFAAGVPYNPDLTGQWNLLFTNGSDTKSILTPSVDAAPLLPFVKSFAITGGVIIGAGETVRTMNFSWTFPNGFTPDGVRLQIWDLEKSAGTLHDLVWAHSMQGNLGTWTIITNTLLEQNHLYSVEISAALTRGGSLGNNTTLLSRSRSFFDFEILPTSAPPNVFLPTVTPGPTPVYTFNVTVVAGQTIFIDPLVAIGYDYAIGAGDPRFASVQLPTGIGDNLFDLFLWNGTSFADSGIDLTGGSQYFFGDVGVDQFRILGIETSAGLDPNNTTAFITGLTFVGSGEFTGTMTPITQEVVPEPTTMLLIGSGLLGLAGLRRKFKK